MKKETFKKVAENLTIIARQELERYDLVGCQVKYLPQLGFLLNLRIQDIPRPDDNQSFTTETSASTSNSNISGSSNKRSHLDKHIKDFQTRNNLTFEFKSDDELYYKNSRMRDLDNEFGDLLNEILYIELDIMSKLQLEFINYSHYYAELIETCGELDCLLAFASVAEEKTM